MNGKVTVLLVAKAHHPTLSVGLIAGESYLLELLAVLPYLSQMGRIASRSSADSPRVFVDNFVHADLHPGNILVQGTACISTSCKEQTAIVDLCDTLVVEVQPPFRQLCLVLLDAGIVAELQSADMQNFRAVFTAVVQGQGEKVAELILHHARANQCQDIERFKAEMAELVTKVRRNTIALGKLQVANLLSSVFKLLMTHKVKLESNFASIIFAIMVLEGLGRSLDPELDILEAAKPLLIRTAASVLE